MHQVWAKNRQGDEYDVFRSVRPASHMRPVTDFKVALGALAFLLKQLLKVYVSPFVVHTKLLKCFYYN